MAVMLQPPLPMIRDTTDAGTESFFDLLKTKHENIIIQVHATGIKMDITLNPMIQWTNKKQAKMKLNVHMLLNIHHLIIKAKNKI